MTKLLIIILPLLLLPIQSFAQSHIVGIRNGLNLTNINSDSFSDSENRMGYNAGISYEYHSKKKYHIGIDLLYFQRGFDLSGLEYDEFGNPTGEELPSTHFIYNYLSIPLKVGIAKGDRIGWFGQAGLVPSLLMNSKVVDRYFGTINTRKHLTKIDVAGLIEVGGIHRLSSDLLIFGSTSFQHSFNSVAESRMKHYSISFSIGFRKVITR